MRGVIPLSQVEGTQIPGSFWNLVDAKILVHQYALLAMEPLPLEGKLHTAGIILTAKLHGC